MTIPRTSTSPTTYCPPAADVLEHFVFSVCQELGPGFDEPDVARGFTDFMATVAQICANNLNRKNSAE